jgi:hypothetical protein
MVVELVHRLATDNSAATKKVLDNVVLLLVPCLNPVGPLMVTEYVAKDHTTIVRNPAYTRKAPWSDRTGPAYLDTIVWKFVPEAGTRVTTLESGETQAIYALPAQSLPRLEKNSGLRVEKIPWPGAPRIWLLNTTKPPLDDVRVRRRSQLGRQGRCSRRSPGHALKAFALTAVMLDIPRFARPIRSIRRRPARCSPGRVGSQEARHQTKGASASRSS